MTSVEKTAAKAARTPALRVYDRPAFPSISQGSDHLAVQRSNGGRRAAIGFGSRSRRLRRRRRRQATTGGTGGDTAGSTLTIYSSLPLQGGSEQQTKAIVNGAKLALKQRNNKIGNFTIKYESLDDSLASTGAADEGQEAQNARTAVRDKTTIALLGAYNSGMTKVSLPITNKAGILQVSPANTYVGLTTDDPGSEKGEPDKYYPSGKKTYARVVPRDTIQAAAMVTAMKEAGCKSFINYNSKTTYSAGLGRNLVLEAEKQGLKMLGDKGVDIKAPNYRSLAVERQGRLRLDLDGDREQRRPAAQGRGHDAPEREAVRRRRGRPQRHRRPEEGPARPPSARASRARSRRSTRRASRRRARSSSRTSRPSTTSTTTPTRTRIYGYEAMDLILDSIEARR